MIIAAPRLPPSHPVSTFRSAIAVSWQSATRCRPEPSMGDRRHRTRSAERRLADGPRVTPIGASGAPPARRWVTLRPRRSGGIMRCAAWADTCGTKGATVGLRRSCYVRHRRCTLAGSACRGGEFGKCCLARRVPRCGVLPVAPETRRAAVRRLVPVLSGIAHPAVSSVVRPSLAMIL